MIVTIEEALSYIKKGDPVGMPTETVYGLAASIDNKAALKKIFQIKKRPFFDPLIIHVADINMAKTVLKSQGKAFFQLAEAFWPGPLTIIQEKEESVSDLITASLPTVGVRMPNHPMALELISKAQTPLAAPSANMFTKTSPTKAEHVEKEFNSLVPVIEGGKCQVGIESTVLGLKEDGSNLELTIFRPGAILKEDIQKVLNNFTLKFVEAKSVQGPGQLPYHYQPELPFYIVEKKEDLPSSLKMEELVLPSESTIAAREVYSELRKFSKENLDAIYLLKNKYPKTGLWNSIWERLYKAQTKMP